LSEGDAGPLKDPDRTACAETGRFMELFLANGEAAAIEPLSGEPSPNPSGEVASDVVGFKLMSFKDLIFLNRFTPFSTSSSESCAVVSPPR
jgi:hypothetical protein